MRNFFGTILALGVTLAWAAFKQARYFLESISDGFTGLIGFAGSGGPGLAGSDSFFQPDKLGIGADDLSGVVDTPRAIYVTDMNLMVDKTRPPTAGTEGGRFGALLRSGAATIRNFLTSTTIGAFNNVTFGRRDHMRDQAAAA